MFKLRCQNISPFYQQTPLYQARAERRLFTELRRYHTMPLRLNWGPVNVHFRKTQFWDPNINVKILFLFENLKNYQAQLFLSFEFSTRVPKNGPKNGPKFKKTPKNDQNHFPTWWR